MNRTHISAILCMLVFILTSCQTTPDGPSAELYDGTTVYQSQLSMGVGYEFSDYDIVPGFTLEYQSGYDGRITTIRCNDRSMTYGDLIEEYQDTFPENYTVGVREYVEMLGFSAVCVTDDTLTEETVETFTRSDIYIEEAENFDIIYTLSDITIDGYSTTNLDRMIDVLGRPRFAAVSWDESGNFITADYYWDMGNDRYLTILNSGAIRFQSREYLIHNRPMFEPFLTEEE